MANKEKASFRQHVEQQLITIFDIKDVKSGNKKIKRGLRKASKILSKALKPSVTPTAKSPKPKKALKIEAPTNDSSLSQ